MLAWEEKRKAGSACPQSKYGPSSSPERRYFFSSIFPFSLAKRGVKLISRICSESTLVSSSKKEGGEGGEGVKKEKKDEDVVFIQDTGFTVKMVAPNLEPFDIQVSLSTSGTSRKISIENSRNFR